ncbi:MAG: 30S ribosomal protein S6 [Candidatus Komeilibacteria bacterium]|nr:30S ribosomal protein S6 [Candidatus Komeilibacteria bacterium]
MRETPKHYELTWILSGLSTDEENKPVNDEVIALLQEKGVLNLSPIFALGKKKLAYPIGQHRHGSYYAVEFDLTPNQLPTINKFLNLNQQLVRFLIVVKQKLSAEEIAKQELSRQKRVRAKEVEKTTKETAKAKEVNKISLEDLDKKLDELLNEDNLNI